MTACVAGYFVKKKEKKEKSSHKKKRLSTFGNTLARIKSRHILRHACTFVALIRECTQSFAEY